MVCSCVRSKRIFGVLEGQFRTYFAMASKSKGVTGKVLLQLLERRLDNVIFRMGLGLSRSNARQIVRHNHVAVNGKRVNIPSYLIDIGDVVSIQCKEKAKNTIKGNLEYTKERTVPSWMEFVPAQLTARVSRLPEKSDIMHPIEEQLIVELYSK